jgi:flagellar biosynthesis/type III secretory pathway protein FliH
MERGYRIGLAHAEADSSRRCSETIEALHALYSDTVDKAHRDVYVVAQRIVEELIEERLRENPDLLMQWIARAIALVKSDIELTLRYHPRHHESLKDVTTHIPRATRTYADPSLGNADFVLDTNIGAITFSWKALLATIKPVESRESNP